MIANITIGLFACVIAKYANMPQTRHHSAYGGILTQNGNGYDSA